MPNHDTIAAIATPAGVGGIGIVRISGPNASSISADITTHEPVPGRIQFRRFEDSDGLMIDHGLCLYFKSPNSFTGEDCIELQAHGGPVVLDMLLERVCELGARVARPGEFSERAFLNGKVDLTQAEAIADLIESGSRTASRAAIRSLEGVFSQQVGSLVDEIIALRAYIEAALDFAEEEIDFLENSDIGIRLEASQQQLQQLLNQAEQGRALQEGLSISLAGLPNAGKSSLLNYLAGYEAAIVTEIEGTTRDVLREHISLQGIPIRLNDTAGLRESDNPVEQEGVRRAWQEIDKADVVIFLMDCRKGLSEADQNIINGLDSERLIQVFSKSDLLDQQQRDPQALYISTFSGEGMEALISRITGQTTDYNQSSQVFMARRRHVDALQKTCDYLRQATESFNQTRSGELIAEDLRQAQQHLNEITGEFTNEDLLGQIFSKFCVGK
jgi:tRNA modification GTPase